MNNIEKYKLCYIENGLAYFTIKNLAEQCGDDWDDVPYEHNAGEPYYENKDDIIKICFRNWNYGEPFEHYYNSPYSVRDINNHEIAWLNPKFKQDNLTPIYAGCSIKNFVDILLKSDGEIYLPINFNKEVL